MKTWFNHILTKASRKRWLMVFLSTLCLTLMSELSPGNPTLQHASPEKPVPAGLDTTRPTPKETAAVQANGSSADRSPTPQKKNKGRQIKQPLTEIKNTYKSILLGKGSFLCTDLANQHLTVREIKHAVTDDASVTVSATKFAISDIDGDGVDEIVLLLKINGISDYGYEILQYHDGEIYGHTLPYKALMQLKTDGTFLFSNGASDFGIGKMDFSKTGYSVKSQVSSKSAYTKNNKLTVQYFINGKPCSKDEFNDAINAQEQKPEVKWHDLSENTINNILP